MLDLMGWTVVYMGLAALIAGLPIAILGMVVIGRDLWRDFRDGL